MGQTNKASILIEAIDQTREAFSSVKSNMRGVESAAGSVKAALAGVGISLGTVFSARHIAGLSDEFSGMQARLKLVSRGVDEFMAANADLVRISTAARVPLAETATLYTRIAASVKDLDVSQEKIASTTEAVALALRISGASAQESSSAMLQFSQAVASGVLRGEEFNAVSEAAPRLLQALAHGIGVPVGQLREMAKQGQLTRDVLIAGLLSQLPALQKEAASLPNTISAAFTDLNNKLLLTIGELDKTTGAARGINEAISGIGTVGIETLAVLGANVAFVFQGVGREIGGISAQLASLAHLDFKGFSTIGKMIKDDAAAARKELDEFEKRILGMGKKSQASGSPANSSDSSDNRNADMMACIISGGNWDGKAKKCTPKKKEGSGKKAELKDVEDYAARINQAVGRAINESDLVRAKEYEDTVAALDKLFFDAGLNAEVYASAMDKLTKAQDGTSDAAKRLEDMLGNTVSARLEKDRADMLLLADAFERGQISVEQYTEAAQARLGLVAESGQDTLDEMKEAIEGWGRDFSKTMAKAAVDGTLSFDTLKDGARSLAAELMAIQMQKRVTKPLLDFGTAAIDSFFSGMAFADGGRPPVGMASLVGERGPELFVPDSAGTVVPNSALGGNNSTYNVSVMVDASGSKVQGDAGQARELGSRIESAVRRVLIDEKRPGGMLATV